MHGETTRPIIIPLVKQDPTRPTHGHRLVAAEVLKGVGAQLHGDQRDVGRVHRLEGKPGGADVDVALVHEVLDGIDDLLEHVALDEARLEHGGWLGAAAAGGSGGGGLVFFARAFVGGAFVRRPGARGLLLLWLLLGMQHRWFNALDCGCWLGGKEAARGGNTSKTFECRSGAS
jgi:hypothetical protein